eukprot:3037635-Pyramimonas_sp.AAC.1
MLQPICRTTGLPSHSNAKVNYDTWHEHHKEDLATHQVLWEGSCTSTLSSAVLFTREATWDLGGSDTAMGCVGQQQGHLQSTYGSMYYRPMANHRLLFTPFDRKRCDGHRPHAS